MSANRLGKNIRALREAFGETQEKLGEAIHVEKNTVSNYEKGKRAPDRETIILIAQHYSVSVEELTNSDLSNIGNITIDRHAFWKNIEIIFPLFSVNNSSRAPGFSRSYDLHKSLFSNLKRGSMDGAENIDVCIEGYFNAYEKENVKYEAAANFIGLWFLTLAMLKLSATPLVRQTAAMMQVASKDDEARRILENTDPNFEKDAEEMASELNDPEINEKIEEMLNVLKHSDKWSDLADYYLALRYAYNLVDNDLEREFNQRIGLEMMNSFVLVRNVYAARFIKFQFEAVGRKFTD